MKIITFDPKYTDDAIFCLLSAKDALGRTPTLNEDMLDVKKNYIDCGDMFWLAVDENDRVVGMLGIKAQTTTELVLKRFYIKPDMKRKGIGSMLFSVAEQYAKTKKYTAINTRFANDYAEAKLFYQAKGFIKTGEDNGINYYSKILM